MRDARIDPGFRRPRQLELLGRSQRAPHQRGDQATQQNCPRSHLSPRCNRHFPRDGMHDSRRRGCHGSHRRAAERLSLLAPNRCALGMRPKNLCDSVTLLVDWRMCHEFHGRSYFDCDWNFHAFFRESQRRRAIVCLSRLDRWATLHHDRDDLGGFWRCGIDRELAFLIRPAPRQPQNLPRRPLS